MHWDSNIIITALTIVIPLAVQQWIMHRANAKAIKNRDRRLFSILGEFPPHAHNETEPNEGLLKKNIRYSVFRINDRNNH